MWQDHLLRLCAHEVEECGEMRNSEMSCCSGFEESGKGVKYFFQSAKVNILGKVGTSLGNVLCHLKFVAMHLK